MFEGLLHAILGFIDQYGYFAVFVYMLLETAFVLHFVPSEVVVPVAASQLVHDPVSFVGFVLDTTAGATVGSLLAYVVFGRYGERALERYGHLIHVSEADVHRSQAVFSRYGESTVFWARMLPFFRALISIPAGLANMGVRRFVVYSAAGAALFNTALTYLVYTGAGTTSPLGVVTAHLRSWLADDLAYVAANHEFVAGFLGGLFLIAAVLWLAREWILDNPDISKIVALHVIRIVGLVIGAIFVYGAVSSPSQAFHVVTAVWNDPLIFVRIGFSEQVAMLLTGALLAIAGTVVYELGKLIEVTRVLARLQELAAAYRR